MSRYLFIDQDINILRDEIKGSKICVYKRLIEQCDTYFDVDLPEAHPNKSTTFMGIAMANLALAYVLNNEKRYFDEAKRWIMACVNYSHWGNAHLVDVDLSAAWILFGMSICYDWLKGNISDEERELIKKKLILQGTRMYEYKIENSTSGWSVQYCQNHNWINLCGLACAGYALQKEYERASKWIDEAKENFEIVYSLLADDGSDYEGVVYWRYGAMWLFIYAHLLNEREGIDYFTKCKFLENTFYYRLYQATGSLEEHMNYGDCHDTRSGHSTAIYYKVADRYNNGYAQKMGNLVRKEFLHREAELSKVKPGILPECFFEVLFYNPKITERDFAELPNHMYFEDLGLYNYRSSWKKGAVCFSYKCSMPGGKKQRQMLFDIKESTGIDSFGLSHQHPDNNSFLLTIGDTYFAIDDGYNRNVMAEDHNVVLVDSQGYKNEGQNNVWKDYTKDMYGVVEKYEECCNYTYIVGETRRTYLHEHKLNALERHFINTNKPFFILIDELKSDIEHVYTWILNSSVYPKYKDYYEYEIDDKTMKVYHFSDADTITEYRERTIRAVMTTQEPDNCTETKLLGLHISNKKPRKELSFFSVLVPDIQCNKGINIERIDCNGGYGIKVSNDNYSETIIYSSVGKFEYKGKQYITKVALIIYKDGNLKKECCL